jgi:hypothetical protein
MSLEVEVVVVGTVVVVTDVEVDAVDVDTLTEGSLVGEFGGIIFAIPTGNGKSLIPGKKIIIYRFKKYILH